MEFYVKYGTIKVKHRNLKLHSQKRRFGSAGGTSDCLSAKLRIFFTVVSFHKIHIWRFMIMVVNPGVDVNAKILY